MLFHTILNDLMVKIQNLCLYFFDKIDRDRLNIYPPYLELFYPQIRRLWSKVFLPQKARKGQGLLTTNYTNYTN